MRRLIGLAIVLVCASACSKKSSPAVAATPPVKGGQTPTPKSGGSGSAPAAAKPSLKHQLPKVISSLTGAAFVLYPVETKPYGYEATAYLDPAMNLWLWQDWRAGFSSAKSSCQSNGGRLPDKEEVEALFKYLGHPMAGENEKIIFPLASKATWIAGSARDCGTGNYYYSCYGYKIESETEAPQFGVAREDFNAQVLCILDKEKNPPVGEHKDKIALWTKDARNADKDRPRELPTKGEYVSEEFSNCRVNLDYKQNNFGYVVSVDVTNPCGKDLQFTCEKWDCRNSSGDQLVMMSSRQFQIVTQGEAIFSYRRP